MLYSVYLHTLLEQAGLVRSHTYTHTHKLTIDLVILIIRVVIIIILRDLNLFCASFCHSSTNLMQSEGRQRGDNGKHFSDEGRELLPSKEHTDDSD